MLKNFYCFLVRWLFDPKAERPPRFARHLSSCAGCRDFFESAKTIEQDLRQPTAPPDSALCQQIMREVRGLEMEPAVADQPPRWGWSPSLAVAALVVTGFLAVFLFWPDGESDLPEPEPLASSEPSPPPAPPSESPNLIEEIPGTQTVRAVANLIEQQELIRRDAKKLGSHLRERVILFQSTD